MDETPLNFDIMADRTVDIKSAKTELVRGTGYKFADINWDLWSPTRPPTATDHRYFPKFLLENLLS